MTSFYRHVNRKVLKSYKMLVVISVLSTWFLMNGYLLHRILVNKTDIRFKYLTEIGAYFAYDKIFNSNFLVLIIIPLFVLLLDSITDFFKNYRIIIRYNNSITWWKNYYKSVITITISYVFILNLLMIAVALMLNLKGILTFRFLLFIAKSACFEFLGFLIISNIFTLLIMQLKNRVTSFVIVCTMFILIHSIAYYMMFYNINIVSFEKFMFFGSGSSEFTISDITNIIWFGTLFLLSFLIGNKLLDEIDLL